MSHPYREPGVPTYVFNAETMRAKAGPIAAKQAAEALEKAKVLLEVKIEEAAAEGHRVLEAGYRYADSEEMRLYYAISTAEEWLKNLGFNVLKHTSDTWRVSW